MAQTGLSPSHSPPWAASDSIGYSVWNRLTGQAISSSDAGLAIAGSISSIYDRHLSFIGSLASRPPGLATTTGRRTDDLRVFRRAAASTVMSAGRRRPMVATAGRGAATGPWPAASRGDGLALSTRASPAPSALRAGEVLASPAAPSNGPGGTRWPVSAVPLLATATAAGDSVPGAMRYRPLSGEALPLSSAFASGIPADRSVRLFRPPSVFRESAWPRLQAPSSLPVAVDPGSASAPLPTGAARLGMPAEIAASGPDGSRGGVPRRGDLRATAAPRAGAAGYRAGVSNAAARVSIDTAFTHPTRLLHPRLSDEAGEKIARLGAFAVAGLGGHPPGSYLRRGAVDGERVRHSPASLPVGARSVAASIAFGPDLDWPVIRSAAPDRRTARLASASGQTGIGARHAETTSIAASSAAMLAPPRSAIPASDPSDRGDDQPESSAPGYVGRGRLLARARSPGLAQTLYAPSGSIAAPTIRFFALPEIRRAALPGQQQETALSPVAGVADPPVTLLGAAASVRLMAVTRGAGDGSALAAAEHDLGGSTVPFGGPRRGGGVSLLRRRTEPTMTTPVLGAAAAGAGMPMGFVSRRLRSADATDTVTHSPVNIGPSPAALRRRTEPAMTANRDAGDPMVSVSGRPRVAAATDMFADIGASPAALLPRTEPAVTANPGVVGPSLFVSPRPRPAGTAGSVAARPADIGSPLAAMRDFEPAMAARALMAAARGTGEPMVIASGRQQPADAAQSFAIPPADIGSPPATPPRLAGPAIGSGSRASPIRSPAASIVLALRRQGAAPTGPLTEPSADVGGAPWDVSGRAEPATISAAPIAIPVGGGEPMVLASAGPRFANAIRPPPRGSRAPELAVPQVGVARTTFAGLTDRPIAIGAAMPAAAGEASQVRPAGSRAAIPGERRRSDLPLRAVSRDGASVPAVGSGASDARIGVVQPLVVARAGSPGSVPESSDLRPVPDLDIPAPPIAGSRGDGASRAPVHDAAADADEIVERAWRALMSRLAIEQERRGFGRWS
jgi:hypothetical protein